ncbi:MAG: hypothetical protein VR72_10285 [Clostridiaceae bacterium BRH_c20a]|nr:MAG: hypothetical protein VR72_10285 [Clostridiaceae bacterium BRH_c20a]
MKFLNIMDNNKQIFLLGYMVLFLLYAFFPYSILKTIMLPIVILILITSYPNLKDYNKYLALVLFVIGTVLMIYNKANIGDVIRGFTDNAGLISLILTVPLLSVIFDYDNFNSIISSLTEKYITSPKSFYVTTLFIINSIGMLLNLASIPLVHQILGNTSQNYHKRLYYRALTRGFCVNLLWSPNFVSIAIVLNYIDISWYKLAPFGFLLAMLNNIIGLFMERKYLKQEQFRGKIGKAEQIDKRKVFKLVFLLLSLIIFIVLLEFIIGKSVLVVVPLVSIIAPVIFALGLKKLDVLKKKVNKYYTGILLDKHNEVFLFTAIGFFGYALGNSPFKQYIPMLIEKLGINTSVPIILFILLVIAGLSIIGVHPLVSISAIAVTVPVASTPLNELQMALTLLTGYMMYNLLSPFSIPTLVMTGLTRESPLAVSLNINLYYVMVSGIITTLVCMLIG